MLLFFFNQVGMPDLSDFIIWACTTKIHHEKKIQAIKIPIPYFNRGWHKKHSGRNSIPLSLKYVFVSLKILYFPGVPRVSWTMPKRVFLSNQCVSYLLTGLLELSFLNSRWLRTTFFKTTGNLLYLKGEYRILVYDFDGKTSKEIRIHTENMFGSATCNRMMPHLTEAEVGCLLSL